jgi:hypothetical protein
MTRWTKCQSRCAFALTVRTFDAAAMMIGWEPAERRELEAAIQPVGKM